MPRRCRMGDRAEALYIEGAGRIPADARQDVAETVHDVLRENHGIDPAAVYWPSEGVRSAD